GGWD
ncbi:Hypothetical protein NocV09_04000260, partial [Nannochloropsis oceanica]